MFVMPLLTALILSLCVHFELDLKGIDDYRFNDIFCSQRWMGAAHVSLYAAEVCTIQGKQN